MKRKFKNLISLHSKPFIIAEMSANHCGSIAKAKKIITAAKQSGASAIKIQTYEAENMTIDTDRPDFQIKHGIWTGEKLFIYIDLLKHFLKRRFFAHAKRRNSDFLNTI